MPVGPSSGNAAFVALKLEYDELLEAAMKLVEHTEAMYRKYARGVVPNQLVQQINVVKGKAGCL